MEDYNHLFNIQNFEKIGVKTAKYVNKVRFYKVREKLTGNIFCIKIVNNTFGQEPQEISKLVKHFDFLISISHPAIVKFYGYSLKDFENEDNAIIFMELVANGSLRDMINREKSGRAPHNWNDSKKLIVIYGICSSLKYLYSKNYYYLDLKPDNILLDKDFYPKLCDLDYFDTERFFTPLYVAPEVIKDENITIKSVVYSFAITCYELYTLDKSYLENKGVMSFYDDVIKEKRPMFRNEIPESIKKLIEDFWKNNPDMFIK